MGDLYDFGTINLRNIDSYSDYTKEVYYNTINNEQIVEDYLKEKYDLPLEELEEIIRKYEPERTI